MDTCIRKIFGIKTERDFEKAALTVFRFQAEHCPPYRTYLQHLEIRPEDVTRIEDIPFLPIELFKSHRVYGGTEEPRLVFTSSGTTGTIPTRHYVAYPELYETSFRRGFELFYGAAEEIALYALLPNYLERTGSSLVYMADRLIACAKGGGFFLHDYESLLEQMEQTAAQGTKILLLGVSFALWELAEKHRFRHPNLIVMETGGMKGRRREIPREELHAILCDSFGVESIHSEYGMTELLSQAYSSGNGVFRCPPWMKVLVRDVHDPLEFLPPGKTGGIDVIDLANLYSCSFIETQDLGTILPDGGFRVAGRIDKSEIRGCNLMVAG